MNKIKRFFYTWSLVVVVVIAVLVCLFDCFIVVMSLYLCWLNDHNLHTLTSIYLSMNLTVSQSHSFLLSTLLYIDPIDLFKMKSVWMAERFKNQDNESLCGFSSWVEVLESSINIERNKFGFFAFYAARHGTEHDLKQFEFVRRRTLFWRLFYKLHYF